MFLVQFIINIFGIGDHDSFDSSDISSDTIHDGGQDSADAKKFKWLSLQTITGFLMMFGWTAITCKNEFGLQDSITMGLALTSGLFASLIIRSIFKLAKKLRSSGSIYRIEDAIGKEGYVYLCIPKGGKGKISMSLQNFTHEIDAISHHSEDLPSFMRVKIIKKSDENTVVVAPL
ncbi:MAG: hypothetical protein NTX49_08400 [Chlamydiae bacterium]|nr:hypothetical protein [Chlamydiota bacterium]